MSSWVSRASTFNNSSSSRHSSVQAVCRWRFVFRECSRSRLRAMPRSQGRMSCVVSNWLRQIKAEKDLLRQVFGIRMLQVAGPQIAVNGALVLQNERFERGSIASQCTFDKGLILHRRFSIRVSCDLPFRIFKNKLLPPRFCGGGSGWGASVDRSSHSHRNLPPSRGKGQSSSFGADPQ